MKKTNHIKLTMDNKVKGYIKFSYSKTSNTPLSFYLKDIDIEDYYIYKSTHKFREVYKEEFLTFKNGGYILFKKDLYDNDILNEWANYIGSISKGEIIYLHKPFPPKAIMNKINIIK